MNNLKTLVQQSLKGDEEAFKDLFDMSYKVIFFKINKIVMDESSSMDILQNTYIKAFNNLSSLKEPKAFLKWINVIATNETKDFLKKKKDINLSALDSDDGDIVFEIEDESLEFRPEAQADINETKDIINKIIYKLPEAQRMVIMMFYFEELQISEIANILELNENTIKSRLRYAKQAIENDVRTLEKDTGIKLYGFAPMAFFVWYLKDTVQSQILPPITNLPPLENLIPTASTQSGIKQALNAMVHTLTPATTSAKVIATVLTSTVLLGGTIAGINSINTPSELKRPDIPTENITLEDDPKYIPSGTVEDNSIVESEANPQKKDQTVAKEPEKYQATANELKAIEAVNKIYTDRLSDPYWIIVRSNVIKSIVDDGFTIEEASYGADNSYFDWKKELVRSAEYFNNITPKSYQELINDLMKVHPKEDATYAANNIEIDWEKQPFAYAKYLQSHSNFSRLVLKNFMGNHGKFEAFEIELVQKEFIVDWNAEAVRFAKDFLKVTKSNTLEDEMSFHEYTTEEILHAKTQLSLD
ncbi:MAG: sigma-70 family RNA polymerase sigma factor [Erysipelothrix sp.]|nr:sigma-70 family RNA polymerase sigma factor [Erysipelothrix sp.]